MLRIRSRNPSELGLALALALTLALGLASAGTAHPGMGPGPREGFFERKLDSLGLAPETRAAVQKLLDDARPTREAARQQIRQAHDAMKALLDAEPVDEAAVMSQADKIGALMTASHKQELRTMIQVRALLSPEERTRLEQMMQEHREGWHRGPHGPGGPGAQGPPQAQAN